MKRLLHTPTAMLLRRIALLYAVLMLCRVIFYLYNAQLLGPLSWGELGQLLAGSLKFDTASVVYADRCSYCSRCCLCTRANASGTAVCCSGTMPS